MPTVCRNFTAFFHPVAASRLQHHPTGSLSDPASSLPVSRCCARCSTTAFFTCVGGELDPINGQHVSANQTPSIPGHQNLAEQGFDLGAAVEFVIDPVVKRKGKAAGNDLLGQGDGQHRLLRSWDLQRAMVAISLPGWNANVVPEFFYSLNVKISRRRRRSDGLQG